MAQGHHHHSRLVGHFDKFLSNILTINLALAYDLQIVEAVPMDHHDIKMDYIFTETKIYDKKAKSLSKK